MVKSWSSWAERDERNSEDHLELTEWLTWLALRCTTVNFCYDCCDEKEKNWQKNVMSPSTDSLCTVREIFPFGNWQLSAWLTCKVNKKARYEKCRRMQQPPPRKKKRLSDFHPEWVIYLSDNCINPVQLWNYSRKNIYRNLVIVGQLCYL